MLMLVLLSGYVLMLGQQPSVDLLLAQGRHQLRGWWNLGEGAANLLLSVYWGRKYGLVGIALGTAAPMIFVQICIQPWYALRTIHLPAMRYLREAFLRPLLVVALVLGLCATLHTWQHPYSAAWLLFSGAWQTVLFIALGWWIVLNSDERAHFLEKAKNALGHE